MAKPILMCALSIICADVTGADAGGNYIGSFSDIEAGKVIGKALIAKGVDVIFTAAGTAGSGVPAAVKEAGTIEKIDAACELLISGDVVPAANFNGITPDDFTWTAGH